MGHYKAIEPGEKFGYLKVIKEVDGLFNKKGKYFLCTCEHGHQQIFPLYKIRSFRYLKSFCNSCFLEGKVIPHVEQLPEEGKTYGVWRVICRKRHNGKLTQSYICECADCGEKKALMIRKILAVKGPPKCSKKYNKSRIDGVLISEAVRQMKYADSVDAIDYVNAERERERLLREGKKK